MPPPRGATARAWALYHDLAEIDAGAEVGLHGLGSAAGENLQHIAAGIFIEPIEFEVAVIVGRRHRYRNAVLDQLHAGAFHAIDHAVLRLGDRAAAEAF